VSIAVAAVCDDAAVLPSFRSRLDAGGDPISVDLDVDIDIDIDMNVDMDVDSMDAYDYGLPPDAIAQEPIEPRSAARLLVSGRLTADGHVGHATMADLPGLLRDGDVVVVNETRVLPARLVLQKSSGGRAEVLLLEPMDPLGTTWEALVRPGRRLIPGTVLFEQRMPGGEEAGIGQEAGVLEVGERLVGHDDGRRSVRLLDSGVIERVGAMPLPPYIHQPLTDPERYQTVYARVPGSVAAPTAGLHLTREILEALSERNVKIVRLNLCVGLATFKPMTASKPEDHVMHSERYEIGRETMDACENARRVVAVGTTVVRALETAAATGELSGQSELFIHGRYPFQLVDVLLTNFHLPRSSLLLLVEAFVGPRWRDLYRVALERGYRFLSFGDAMLLERRSW